MRAAPLGVIWIGFHLARCALNRGQPANRYSIGARRVQAAIDASGFEGLRPAAPPIQAVAHGLLGDAANSARLAARVDASTARVRVHRPRASVGPGLGADRSRRDLDRP